MLVRRSKSTTTSVHISDLNFRLPGDNSWVEIPEKALTNGGSSDLKYLFENGLVDVDLSDDDTYPDWYLDALTDVRIPMEVLLQGAPMFTVDIKRLKEDAHPMVWALIRRKLLNEEAYNKNRSFVVSMLEEE